MSMQIGKGGAVSKAKPLDQNLTTDTERLERPIPLLRPIEPGWDLPLDYLGALREPVEAIAEKTSAPIEIAFQSVLATAALATQHISDVETLSGTSPLSLFLLTIAASGERKSSCDRLAISPIQDWEEENDLQYREGRADYEFEQDQFDALRRKAVRSETDGVVDAVTPQAPVPPVVPRKLLGDITFEGLLRHFDEGDPSIGIFADEGGQFFGGHGMGRDNQLKTASGLSKLWDAAPLNRTRAGSPQATYRHRRGSLHLMIQPGVAETVLSNQILRDQGLLSRMLIAWPRSRIGQRLIVLSDERVERLTRADMSLRSYHQRISQLLNQTDRSNFENLELRPRKLKLSAEAKNLLICFANQVETEQGPSQRLASISGFAS